MRDVLGFFAGLVSAALRWLAGLICDLICVSPIFFLSVFGGTGRLSEDPPMPLIAFFLPGCFFVWFGGYLTRQVAPDLSQSEPYGYGQATIGAILCFLGIAESIRTAAVGRTTIYPMLLLFIPGLMLLLDGIRILMLACVVDE
jgi:hypothetical protein